MPSILTRLYTDIFSDVIQQNFTGLNTFGTMKICPRQGVVRANESYSARSGGILRIYFRFSLI